MDPDNELTALPDQIWGLYIGWAKFDGQKVFKASRADLTTSQAAYTLAGFSIAFLFFSSFSAQPCILNESDADKDDSKMQLLLVGYLQRSCGAGNILNNLDILDEDKLTAVTALNLPAYSHHSSVGSSVVVNKLFSFQIHSVKNCHWLYTNLGSFVA
ncbi:UNVERIFIED_CONTAM: hypothetical protein Sindi_2835500 [Sesamum indicum]